MRKDKILFIFERCEYDDNKILVSHQRIFRFCRLFHLSLLYNFLNLLLRINQTRIIPI